MTTEDDFQRALDANPDDHVTRLVFADWLQERDDPRAEGYRALGSLRLWPHYEDIQHQRYRYAYGWSWHSGAGEGEGPHRLPDSWVDSMNHVLLDWAHLMIFRTRRDAEDTAALAFAKLPAERRGELLATAPV